MDLSPKDADVFRKHLQDHGGMPTCPMCNSPASGPKWGIVGVVNLPVRTDPAVSQSLPVLPMICSHCRFVALFAWRPISSVPSEEA